MSTLIHARISSPDGSSFGPDPLEVLDLEKKLKKLFKGEKILVTSSRVTIETHYVTPDAQEIPVKQFESYNVR
jgi:hypothetical protein